MILLIPILVVVGLLASGMLFAHQRMLTYLATAGVLFEALWLGLTFIDRVLFRESITGIVFWVGGLAALFFTLFFIRTFRFPYQHAPRSGRRDAFVLILIGAAVICAGIVLQYNGLTSQGDWVGHGFFNGDTVTFISLVQRSFLFSGLVDTNPFSAGGDLEYPTLLHAGVAQLIEVFGGGVGSGWLSFIPLITYVQIILTVPLFFLLFDLMFPEKFDKTLWLGVPSHWLVLCLEAFIVLLVMAYSWDSFIFLQSHFLLTGLFLLLVASLIHKRLLLAHAVALLLLFSNAVTGTAAMGCVVIYLGMGVLDMKLTRLRRLCYLSAICVWVFVFFIASPGEAAFGFPGFSYTAAEQVVRMAPLVLLLLVSILLSFEQRSMLPYMAGGVAGLTFFVFFFSTREIVVENSERFFYHALLIGFPILLPPAIDAIYSFRRRLFYTTLLPIQRIVGWVAAMSLVLLILFPGIASAARSMDSLIRSDFRYVPLAAREGMWWLLDHAAADATILASPDSPWAVPLFTGRALARTDYWLSSRDEALGIIMSAFSSEGFEDKTGSLPKNEAIALLKECLFNTSLVSMRWCQDLQDVDYVILNRDDVAHWSLPHESIQFTNGHINIYRRSL